MVQGFSEEKYDTLADFIEELNQKGIEISFSAGKLKYSGPDENITPELIERLRRHKGNLIKSYWPKELGNLMPINPQGSKIPLFIIHGDNGNYIISDHLGPDQPVYGFFHPGSEGERIHYKSVKKMAREYLDKIISVNPDGPYYLLGYSFGGNLAFEIAVQLQKLGQKVPFLALLDTESPGSGKKVEKGKNLFMIIRKNILGAVRRGLDHFIRLSGCRFYFLMNIPLPAEKRTFYMWIKYSSLVEKYRPEKFNGDMLYFRATQPASPTQSVGWSAYVDNIKVIDMYCKHLEIFSGRNRTEVIQKEVENYLTAVSNSNY